MKTALVLAIALGLGTPRDTPKEQDEIKQEISRLKGEWESTGAEKGGQKLNEEERRKLSEFFLTKVAFTDDTIQLWIEHKGAEAKPSEAIAYTLDLSKKPRQMKFDRFTIIYAVDGDTFKACFTDDNEMHGTPPASFDTNTNEKAYLFLFKRVKK